MSQSIFRSRYSSHKKTWSNSGVGSNFGRRIEIAPTSTSYINLEWLKNLVQRLENISNVPTFAYQLVALGLLTFGLGLAFQNFNSNNINDNAITQTKVEIARLEEKRIWTNTNSIDNPNVKINYTVVAAADISNSTDNCNGDGKTEPVSTLKCDKIAEVKPKIPTLTITVIKGDTLIALAKKYKTTTGSIIELNDLKSNNLKLGQTLLIEDTTPVLKSSPKKIIKHS